MTDKQHIASKQHSAIIALGSNISSNMCSNLSSNMCSNISSNISSDMSSNISNRERDDCASILDQAIAKIGHTQGISVSKVSSYIKSAYQGPGKVQPDYTNAAIAITTTLAPLDLLHTLQAIEVDFGRPKPPRPKNQPRVLDLDIITYEDLSINTPELTLPHPLAKERSFVMEPINEILGI